MMKKTAAAGIVGLIAVIGLSIRASVSGGRAPGAARSLDGSSATRAAPARRTQPQANQAPSTKEASPATAARSPTTRPQSRASGDPRAGGGLAALTRAAKAKKHLFVFFHKDNGEETSAMRAVFETAMRKVAGRAMSVAIDVTDPAEKGIVTKFGTGRAPMPLVLAIAPNGAVTGGFPVKFEEKQLLGAFASPGMQQCLKALQERKLVLLCVQNAGTSSNSAAMRGVRDFKADARFGQATVVVTLDPNDAAEATFLKQLRIDAKSDEAITARLAPPGSVVAKVTGATEKDKLVAALTKAMASCGSGCGPRGCPPKK